MKLRGLTLRKKIKDEYFYLMVLGNNIGRWTRYFSPHCIADSLDCKDILNAFKEQEKEKNNETEEIEVSIEIDLPYKPNTWYL